MTKNSFVAKVTFKRKDQRLNRECSIKKDVLESFTKFKHLEQSPFLNKVAGPGTYFFAVSFVKF